MLGQWRKSHSGVMNCSVGAPDSFSVAFRSTFSSDSFCILLRRDWKFAGHSYTTNVLVVLIYLVMTSALHHLPCIWCLAEGDDIRRIFKQSLGAQQEWKNNNMVEGWMEYDSDSERPNKFQSYDA